MPRQTQLLGTAEDVLHCHFCFRMLTLTLVDVGQRGAGVEIAAAASGLSPEFNDAKVGALRVGVASLLDVHEREVREEGCDRGVLHLPPAESPRRRREIDGAAVQWLRIGVASMLLAEVVVS